MKVGIQQPILLEALQKGALPALSDDAQSDFSNTATLMKSVKISAYNDCFSLESQTNMSSNRFHVVPSKETGVIVKEEGVVLVNAKDLLSWVMIQGSESVINIALDKLAIPEAINAKDDDTVDDKFAIKKIGTLKIVAKDNKKTGNKWELDGYDPDHVKLPAYKDKGKKQFTMGGDNFIKSIQQVSFACLKKDDDHVLDSISIQKNDGKCYFIGTNKTQCASYIPEGLEDVGIDESLLISMSVLSSNMKVMNPHGKVTLYYKEDKNKIFFEQDNFDVRISMVDKDTRGKFASINILLSKTYEDLAKVPKQALRKILGSASLVNKRSVLMHFNSKDDVVMVKALTTFGKRPSVSRAELKDIQTSIDFVCGAGDIINALRTFSDDLLCFTHCPRILKITSNEDKGFTYYSILFNDPIYNDLRKEIHYDHNKTM